MKSHTLKFLVLALSGTFLLAAATPAEARHDRGGHREWRHDHPHGGPPGRAVGHYKHHRSSRYAPPHVVVHRHHYHPTPKRHHRHHHRRHSPPSSAVVVTLPDLVFPLR